MTNTEKQTEALRLAVLLEQGRWLPAGNGSPIDEAAAELRRLDAENKALLAALEAVEMDVVEVGMGENVIGGLALHKVEDVLQQVRAAQARKGAQA
ncbi:hypothetical protein [Delftia tsuruhatensis]|uniref:Coil containing protein n=1 Tax=Delftia tsuruhatensis TaxID=180282 RepID=A0ABM6E5M1_9BURK|nr:hypothetical protein [Delftia tsuruhatensis]AOV02786.1 hypothetical protein BI380_16280 [Delftia tsuruhatensis]